MGDKIGSVIVMDNGFARNWNWNCYVGHPDDRADDLHV